MSTLLSFRAEDDLAKVTDEAAKLLGCSRSEYLRKAVEKENHWVMEKRIAYLSKALSEVSHEENLQLDGSIGDGLGES